MRQVSVTRKYPTPVRIWSALEYHNTESPIAKSNARQFHQLIVTSTMNPNAKATDVIYRFRGYMRAFDSFSPTPLSDDDKNAHLDRFCAHTLREFKALRI